MEVSALGLGCMGPSFGHGTPTDRQAAIALIRAGDIIFCDCGEKHGHGATAGTAMPHVAISESLDGKEVEWLEKVTAEEYLAEPQSW